MPANGGEPCFIVFSLEFAYWWAKEAFKYAENLKMQEEKGQEKNYLNKTKKQDFLNYNLWDFLNYAVKCALTKSYESTTEKLPVGKLKRYKNT